MNYNMFSIIWIWRFRQIHLCFCEPLTPSPSEGSNEEYLAYDKPDSLSSVAQVYYKYHQKPGIMAHYITR